MVWSIGEPGMATSTFTQLLSSDENIIFRFVAFELVQTKLSVEPKIVFGSASIARSNRTARQNERTVSRYPQSSGAT